AYRHEEHLLTGEDPERFYITQLMPTKLALDLQYVAMQSLPLDVKIILKTVGSLVRRTPQPALMTPAAMLASRGATEQAHRSQVDVKQTPQPAASGQIRAGMQDWLQHHIVRRVRSYGLSVILDVLIVSCAFDTATVLQYADTGTADVELARLFLP